jgi:hypothetical protein
MVKLIIGVAMSSSFLMGSAFATCSVAPSNGTFCLNESVILSATQNISTNEEPDDPCGCGGMWGNPATTRGWSGNFTGITNGASVNLVTSTTGSKSVSVHFTNI